MTAQNPDASDPQAPPSQVERLRVARIGKPHGVRGETTVQLFTDDPSERLAPGSVLVREPGKESADRTSRTLTVSSQRWNKNICLLGFDEVGDRDAAEGLRGSVLFVELPAESEEDDEWYSHELEGMVCLDADGKKLGVVRELITGPAQDLLVVETSGSQEVLVPFVGELVPDIDPESGIVRLDPPAGLF